MNRMILLHLFLLSMFIHFSCLLSAKQYSEENIEMVHLLDETRYVCNPEHILSSGTVSVLDGMLKRLEDSTGIEMVVVVVDSLQSRDCYTFSLRLGSKFGVGGKNQNSGLIVTLSTSDRCVQILTGRGLEGFLPDAICRRIQVTQMDPFLKDGDYDKAILMGVQALVERLDGTMKPEVDNFADKESLKTILIFFGILIVLSIWIYYRDRKCPNCGKYKLKQVQSYLLRDNRSVRETEVIYACEACQYRLSRKKTFYKGSDYHTGGYGGIGGLGGGFRGGLGGGPRGGSFGGGSFGGGGSSWKF